MKEKLSILAYFNKYKNTLDDYINNLDSKQLNWAGLIIIRSYNISSSKTSSIDFSRKNYLNENFSKKSLQLTPKTKNL